MKPHLGVAALLLTAAALAACGGGSATPFVGPPASASALVALSTSSTTSVSLSPINNGSSAKITFPVVSGAANANVSLQSAAPSGAPQPQAKSLAKAPQGIGGTNLTVLDYVLVSVDQSVSITQTPAFVFSLASAPPSGSAYIAELDVNHSKAGWSVLDGPGTVSGNTISFSAQTLAPPFTLAAKDTYVFALVVSGSTITPPPPTIPPGATASFSGNKSVNYTYGFAFAYPTPGPTATAPPTTLTYSVTDTVSVGSSPFPTTAPSAQLEDEHVVETDNGSVASNSFSTDSWISVAASGTNYNELLFGQTQQQPTSANLPVTTTLYSAPQILDRFPETNGATWTNVPAANVAYSYANGDAGTRVVASDGTYTDTETLGSGQAVISEKSDGSGSLAGPFYGGGFIDSITVSGPTPMPSASPIVAITFNYDPAVQGPPYNFPPTQVIGDYVWYPYTAGQPISFYNESDSVTTGASLPSACTPNPYGSTANDVRRTITTLDTMIGFVETTQFDSYNVNGFPVCLTTNDVLNYAYDFQGNSPYTVLIGQLGLQVVTTNETLVIQNVPSTSSTTAAARTAEAGPARAAVVALQAHELSSFAAERARRTNTFMHLLRSGQNPRAVLIRGGRK